MKFVVALALLPALAHADALSDGEQLAKRGKFKEAIAVLREADAAQPNSKSACLLGLAHLRAGHPSEAEVRFAQCHARGEPPDWLPGVEAELAPQLAAMAKVTIAGTDDDVTVSGWRDAPFEAQPIHLPPGHYRFTSGKARGELDVDDAAPAKVTLGVPLVPVAVKRREPTPAEPPTRTSTYVLGGGIGLALIGAAVHAFILQSAWSTLDGDTTGAMYDRDYGAYRNARIATIALYGAAAIAIGVGLYLRASERVVVTPTAVAVRW